MNSYQKQVARFAAKAFGYKALKRRISCPSKCSSFKTLLEQAGVSDEKIVLELTALWISGNEQALKGLELV